MIRPEFRTLGALFSDRVFRIPHYQRYYSWQKRQREDLFGDITKAHGQGLGQTHFMATIVCHKTSEVRAIGTKQYTIYDLVDGQQRLTTLITLLKTIELALPEDSEDRKELREILVKKDGQLLLLQSNNTNERIFNNFLRDGTIPNLEELQTTSDRTLRKAFLHCRQHVKNWEDSGKELAAFMATILHQLGFVVHDTEDSRAVYTVFEVLNSRGLPVDSLDKCKSFLMSVAFDKSQSESATSTALDELQKVWSQIYQELAKEGVRGEEVLRVAATLFFVARRKRPPSAGDSLDSIRVLHEKSETDANETQKTAEKLLKVARALTKLMKDRSLESASEIFQARILAVALLVSDRYDEAELRMLLDQWERVTFRIFGLYGKDARVKIGDYVSLGTAIVRDELSYTETLARLRGIGEAYPVDGGAEALLDRDFYEESPKHCKHLLLNYEYALREAAGSSATVCEETVSSILRASPEHTIEHIVPQSFRNSGWNGFASNFRPGRIGNLTLLPPKLNSQAREFDFETKRPIYKKHMLRITQEIANEDDWLLDRVEDRELRIVEWAKIRWADLR